MARRTLDARPDTLDFRDRMFEPTLIEVPVEAKLDAYKKAKVPVLDQGQEGACTGFGLATVVHYLLRTRKVYPDTSAVSPYMLYALAKRYDEWAGEAYEGSSARGAMKGWHKHGVCSLELWPKSEKDKHELGEERAGNAAQRPLGAYCRVNHRDIVSMHAAIAEVGILYASALVHRGWDRAGRDGIIKRSKQQLGGHAFAIVAYDADGFWVQNSWGASWGLGGFGRVSYRDWLDNGTDAWVARLGAPVRVDHARSVGGKSGGISTSKLGFNDVRPHVVSIGNDGRLRESGLYGNSAAEVETIVTERFVQATRGWKRKRLLLYAHGGLVPEDNAIQRVEDYIEPLLRAQIYPLAFIWKTDFWTTLGYVLQDALRRRRSAGLLTDAKDFMLDRLDDALEPIARAFGGKLQWDEMKENALRATTDASGGARLVAALISGLLDRTTGIEVHLAAHSAGSILLAPLAQYLAATGVIGGGPMNGVQGLGRRIETCTLWAPACTVELFKSTYLPVIEARQLVRFALFNLTDAAEQDDNCADIYHKSLLYLVSYAFENKVHIPLFREGEPILGMDRFATADSDVASVLGRRYVSYVKAPNTEPMGADGASRSRHHGDFDDDEATVRATLARILSSRSTDEKIEFPRSAASTRDRRERIAHETGLVEP